MEKVAALTEITRRQEHLIAEMNHALHGKRSEKLSSVCYAPQGETPSK